MIRAVGGAQAEILRNAAATLLDHRIEGGAIAVAVEGMEQSSQSAAGPSSAPRCRPSMMLDLGADEDPVASDVPVEDDVAGARQRQRAPLRIG